MQLKLKPVVTGLCLLGLVNVPAFAASTSDNISEQQLIQKLSEQTAALQKEVAGLQSQITTLKKARYTSERHKYKESQAVEGNGAPVQPATVQTVSTLKNPVAGRSSQQPVPLDTLTAHPIYVGGTPVITSPFVGERSAFDASDLMVSLPYVGTELRLLKQRKKIQAIYSQYGLTSSPDNPFVDISGGLEAQYVNQKPYTGNKTSDIDLTRGEIDIAANINSWVMGFMSLNYDNTPPATGQLVSNSRIFLDRGFITVGNLNKSPFYATIGQIYVPFGNYTSYMVSDSLPKLLARIKDRALLLGYDQSWSNVHELNVSTFAFKGDSKTSENQSAVNQLGMNLDYDYTQTNWNAAIGGSLITNMADSLGMQETGGIDNGTVTPGGFNGFASNEILVRRVPAYDLHGNIGIGSLSFLGEYVEAFHDFSPQNLTYNGHGADPAALNLEAAYSFNAWNRPSSFAVGYGRTKDALALLLPQQRYITAFNISIWKDTIESIEYRHDINYPGSAVATGQGVAVTNTGVGHASDTLTFQIGVYF